MNATNDSKMSAKKHYMEPQHGVPGHYRPAQPIQVECMGSLCGLWLSQNLLKINKYAVRIKHSIHTIISLLSIQEPTQFLEFIIQD